MDREVDVLVVGAGPTGSTAAKYAALGGAEVALIERDPKSARRSDAGRASRNGGSRKSASRRAASSFATRSTAPVSLLQTERRSSSTRRAQATSAATSWNETSSIGS